MRSAFTLLHRWFGLLIAAFLFMSGVTGAVISWDHELDDLLNPHLMDVQSRGPVLDPLVLAQQLEVRDRRVRATYVPLEPGVGRALAVSVQPRVDSATGRLFEPGYSQVFIDPVTGRELGRRDWGAAWPITSETFVSFLYKLHYSLHVPEMWGIDRWGLWLMGSIAAIWAIDCFIGFYLTFPLRHAPNPSRLQDVERALRRGWWARWQPAWRIKTSGSGYRISFDVHRAFGLWTWLLLFMLAFTAFSLNFYREIFLPLMSTVSELTPTPFSVRSPTDKHRPIEPNVDFAKVLDLGRHEAARRGWSESAGAVSYNARYGIYGVRFFQPGDDHGAAGVGPSALYFDADDGRLLGDRQPWKGTAADIFVQAQFPLHSGRILGLPGRILISVMGLVVATLSVTGVVIWYRKRRARVAVRRHLPTRHLKPATRQPG